MIKHLLGTALLFATASNLIAQAPPPPGRSAEASAPFSWFLVPSDVIGFKDCPQGFQLTYDGAINNGYGEIDIDTGPGSAPLAPRVKTLRDGYFPVVQYRTSRDGLQYQFAAAGATYGFDPREDLVALVRIHVSNPTSQEVKANLRATWVPRRPFGRSDVGCRKWYEAKFMSPARFHQGAEQAVSNGVATRNGHLLFLYSGNPAETPGQPSLAYHLDLAPGGSTNVDLRIPFVPIDLSREGELAKVQSMTFDSYLPKVIDFWQGIFSRGTSIQVDDPKVVDTMRSSLAYDLIARDVEADGVHFTQTVNKFQYHGFFMRDTSFIARSYEMLNLPDVARTTVEKYLIRDPQGRVTRFRHEMPDDWGQSLWALGSYIRATGDRTFAAEILPAIHPHLQDFVKATSGDPLGLWPVAGPYDNELINGHYTSHNLWALLGLQEAENICRIAGDTTDASWAHQLYGAFRTVFLTRLDALSAKADGYIPPGMDDPLAGYDWENASGGVYPFRVLPPFDPKVTATVNMEREYKYREGIMTWGPNAWAGKVAADQNKPYDPLYLHDYDTFQVDEALLAREEQQKVVEDLYSTLVHTSSTNGGFETSIRPWGNRDPSDNFPPHGWFAARYNELLRNMLVREDGDDLHLASALAPQWVEPGRTVRIERALTNFGTVGFELKSRPSGEQVTISSNWRTGPRRLVFHLPWFVRATSATADGKRVAVRDGEIQLSPNVHHLSVSWRWTQHSDLSYARAVKHWLHKAYDASPGEDTDHLFPAVTRPGLADPQTLFADRYLLQLVHRSPEGRIHFTLNGSTPTPRSPSYAGPLAITRSATLKAIEVWPDGTVSPVLIAHLEKAHYVDAASARAATPGLAYQYLEGSFNAMPSFHAQADRTGIATQPDLDVIQHRAENFAVHLEGYLRVPRDGIYTLVTGSDDGSKLWVGDRLVVDNDGPHAYAEQQGQVALKAGLHPVRIDFFDAGGANYLHVYWSGPGIKRQLVPSSAWWHL